MRLPIKASLSSKEMPFLPMVGFAAIICALPVLLLTDWAAGLARAGLLGPGTALGVARVGLSEAAPALGLVLLVPWPGLSSLSAAEDPLCAAAGMSATDMLRWYKVQVLQVTAFEHHSTSVMWTSRQHETVTFKAL